jgi:hypothetical protein
VILYAVRRWLHFTPDEWDALSWDIREAYLEGLSEEPDIPFQVQQAPAADLPVTRRVAAGTSVIDLDAMRAELEANPAARRRI